MKKKAILLVLVIGIALFSGCLNENKPQAVADRPTIHYETKMIEVLIRQYSLIDTKGQISVLCNYDAYETGAYPQIPFEMDCKDYLEPYTPTRELSNGEILVNLYKAYPTCEIRYSYDYVRNISKDILKQNSRDGLVACAIRIDEFPKTHITEYLGIPYKNENFSISLKDIPLKESDKWIKIRDENQSRTPQMPRYEHPSNDVIYLLQENDFFKIESFINDYFSELELTYDNIFNEEE